MWNLEACTVCLSTDVKLYNMDSFQLRQDYNLVAGLKTRKGNGMPDYLCVECSAYVKRSKKFREKCRRAFYTLQDIIQRNEQITISDIKSVDRAHFDILPSLSYMDSNTAYFETVMYQKVKNNNLSWSSDEVPVIQHNTNESCFSDVTDKKPMLFNPKDSQIKIEGEKESLLRKIKDDNKELIKNSLNEDDNTNEEENYSDNNDSFFNNDSDIEIVVIGEASFDDLTNEDDANGINLEEYAIMLPMPEDEARAAVEIIKNLSQGQHRCEVCNHGFHTYEQLQTHMQMHNMNVSGLYFCEFCQYFFKTDYLLKTHLAENHKYKFLCQKCNVINFDRLSAKQHYILTHSEKPSQDVTTMLRKERRKPTKGVVPRKRGYRQIEMPEDFFIYTTIGHEEQYKLILDRKNTRNYKESKFKCKMCYKGFRESRTYEKHLRRHDPVFSGQLQCDVCKLRFMNVRKIYKHVTKLHLYKFSCQYCKYVAYNRWNAYAHYRWHKNDTFKCPNCDSEFKKLSTCLSHVRIKHPSTFICNMCGHSFVSEVGLNNHTKIAHTRLEIAASKSLKPDPDDSLYCPDCEIQFVNENAFKIHLGSSNKHASYNLSTKYSPAVKKPRGRRGRTYISEVHNVGDITATECEVCGITLSNDVQAKEHYHSEHPGYKYLKRYMCDVCGHTTKNYANLQAHLRTHTKEKPHECPHCFKMFSQAFNRDRHVQCVHEGEKPFKCPHCDRCFTQNHNAQVHIRAVHPNLPNPQSGRRRIAKKP